MNKAGKIIAADPPYAIPGGEVAIDCDGFHAGEADSGCYIGGELCRLVAASSSRILAIVPEGITSEHTHIHLESGGDQSGTFPMVVGKRLVGDMHIVANPAIDPKDDAIILTRSGSRGQHLPVTLFRLEADGYLDEMPDAIMTPTGIAFDKDGQMYVTNRAEGEVHQVSGDGTSTVYATGLGIATGIAFGPDDLMYIGDRAGTIHRVRDFAEVETFTVMEPSVAAYHIAFGPDGRLFVTSPGLASHDAVHAVDNEGFDEKYFSGLGRPQGIAFDTAGNLYVAGCYRGRHGIAKITPGGLEAEHFVAANNAVGLCFTRKGDMIVATNDSVYSLPLGITGTLLK
ncbi:MAG: gluconolaconase [Acidobacteriota bacterium]